MMQEDQAAQAVQCPETSANAGVTDDDADEKDDVLPVGV